MTDEFKECEFCDRYLDDDEDASGVCESCWYGMRLYPFRWAHELRKEGKIVEYIGGCIAQHVDIPADEKHGRPAMSGPAIVCRNGYVRVRKPTWLQRWRSLIDGWKFRLFGDPWEDC